MLEKRRFSYNFVLNCRAMKSNKKIIIIDYGAGNLRSVQKAIEHVGYAVSISHAPEDIADADVLVLPGQGAFAEAATRLESLMLTDLIIRHIRQGKPYLGICLGFQLLFDASSENGHHKGFGIFPGTVDHFSEHIATSLSVPHMGWNTLAIQHDPHHYFEDLHSPIHAYFVHSYMVKTTDSSIIATETDYGVPFVSSVQQDSMLATQFHPEKSSDTGLKILDNFFKGIDKNDT